MAVCVQDLGGRIAAASLLGLLAVPVLMLGGCGGGGGGGIDVAEGQGPDPVIVDVPIAYVKQPLTLNAQGNLENTDARELLTFNLGADLYVRERASATAEEINVTAAETQGLGDVRDVEASFDGSRILFAMRGPFDPNLNDDEQPTWNIWEYEIASRILRRIIDSDNNAEAGHDVAPHYLPDGRIIFSSTRQRGAGAVLVNEGKDQFPALEEDLIEPAFVLHVMNADGGDIHQVSYNQSHDLDPSVLSNGQVVFSRWDNAGPRNAIHLYRMNPDGTQLEMLYGFNSHDTGSNGADVHFLQPREMPDGRLLTVLRPLISNNLGGALTFIDTANYLDNSQANAANAGVLAGPAQVQAVINDVRTDGSISPGGSFGAAYPLWDGTDRMFVSWSQCRVLENGQPVPCTPARLADPNVQPAAPLYGIWIYDMSEDTQLPVVPPEEGMIFTEVVAAQPRSLPPFLPDIENSGFADPQLLAEGTALINIRSVYDVDGVDVAVPDIPTLADPVATPADQRPARFLRIVKAVGIPDDDVRDFSNTAFGRTAINGMREIIGYVPIEPDGSVRVKVPADVPLQISVLDAQGRRIGIRHNSWLQLRAGQELDCSGCHDPASGLSHGRSDAFDTAYPGALVPSQPFLNTDPAIFADFGETMAEARARLSCATDCAAITPTVDVIYTDVWTAPGNTPADPFDYLYADLDTPAPASDACQQAWAPICRIVINYETHIAPLWDLPRLAQDGVTDVTCTACHRSVDANNAPMLPAGQRQLDLTNLPDAQQPLHLVSYRELMFADDEQFLDVANNILRDVSVQIGTDPVTGDPIFGPVTINPPMSTAGAAASAVFFAPFSASHAGWLSPAELRLISEWLDVGGQYFNNPFDAPLN